MPTTIKLNSKSGIMAVEIDDISSGRILPPELEPTKTTPS